MRVELRHVRHQILDDRHVRQRIDGDITLDLVDPLDAGERVRAVDIHGARAADPFAARAAECHGGIDLVFDLDERVEHHGPAGVEVHLIGVGARILVVVGIPAIDLEALRTLRAIGGREGLSLLHDGVRWQGEFSHSRVSDQ